MTLNYFDLLPAHLRRYFAEQYLDPHYNTIWCRLAAFDYLEGNFTYDTIIYRAITHNYPRIAITMLSKSENFTNSTIKTAYNRAITSNCIPLLDWLLANHPGLDIRELARLHPTEQAIALMQRLYQNKRDIDGVILVFIRFGQIGLLKSMIVNRLERNHYVRAAIASGDVNMFLRIINRSITDTQGKLTHRVSKVIRFDLIAEIVQQGQLAMLQLAIDNYHCTAESKHLIRAIKLNRKIESRNYIIELLISRKVVCDDDVMLELASSGELMLMRRLMRPGLIDRNYLRLCRNAASSGQVNMLMFLRDYAMNNNSTAAQIFLTPELMRLAIMYSHVRSSESSAVCDNYLDTVQYCYRIAGFASVQPTILNRNDFSKALNQGNLAMLRWLHQLQCPVSYPLLSYVSLTSDDSVELLDFLEQHYPQFTQEKSYHKEIDKFSPKCYRWLQQRNMVVGKLHWHQLHDLARVDPPNQTYPYQYNRDFDYDTIHALLAANDIITIRWLIHNSDLATAIEDWMIEGIVRGGYLTVLKLLWPIQCYGKLLHWARASLAFDIVQWLEQQQGETRKTKRQRIMVDTI